MLSRPSRRKPCLVQPRTSLRGARLSPASPTASGELKSGMIFARTLFHTSRLRGNELDYLRYPIRREQIGPRDSSFLTARAPQSSLLPLPSTSSSSMMLRVALKLKRWISALHCQWLPSPGLES
ncbi:hypothetical protein HRR83_008843 [Exophiala dermatitidis]|uniref:Uncharacterized protein n=1 Tax=Exophiala dermatitidis TaxID=5970 RepID=A0AAN6EKR0_EXODE|nr:hypothetical protein HRR73_008981 [Exophiala dermatitidis]KAJ4508370.1 hypothetical protein HRR74_007769 [Exophiala dermatitidis]KAJ4533410.1 hypothetical protein HRR77_008574 [Exophiala dermatitidis]KAJ4540290.1 hypothetical protein HRR76_003700 [Exophiala dermatitidis]KAJ4559050.1 hypothetical protein HRR79_008477 [Exophiala dermatitidis]